MLKKAICTCLLGSLFCVPLPAFAQESLPSITLQQQTLEHPAYLHQESIYLPVRLIGDSLGYTVKWSKETNSVTLYNEQNYYALYIGKDYYLNNKKSVRLNQASIMYQDNLYAPSAFFTDIMDIPLNTDSSGNIQIFTSITNALTDNATTLEAGDYFAVTLETNPSTGYQWSYEFEEGTLKPIAAVTKEPDQNLAGSPASITYIFLALAPSEQLLTFTYSRPWDKQPNDRQALYPIVIKTATEDTQIK